MENKTYAPGAGEVCRALGLADFETVVGAGWHESMAHMPESLPWLLTREHVESVCGLLAMRELMAHAVMQAADVMAADLYWRRLAWHAYWQAFEADPPADGLNRWPSLLNGPPPGNLFYVVVTLATVPRVERLYEQRNIPVQLAVAAWRTWIGAVELHRHHFGSYGVVPATFNFFRRFVRGELFELGRLRYHFDNFAPKLKVFRRQRDGVVLALSEPDVSYRADGELYVPSRGDEHAGVWTSVWSEHDEYVTGNPIIPRGKCLPRPVTLSLKEWVPVLRRGDNVLQIHVPGGTALDFDACGLSLRQAGDFFGTYFPQQPFKAYALNTWFLDDQLEAMLRPGANMIKFQHEMYLHPVAGTTAQAMRWLFGSVPEDLSLAPRTTSLQRRVLDHVQAGGIMTGGGGFILADELRWGTSRYRRQYELPADILD